MSELYHFAECIHHANQFRIVKILCRGSGLQLNHDDFWSYYLVAQKKMV